VSKFKDIKEVFKKHLPRLQLDRKLLKRLYIFRTQWMYRDENHINFLSTNLIGVYPISFTKQDEEVLYEMFEVDISELRNDLYTLEDIHADRHVSSNPLYLLFLYLMHVVYESKMSKHDKEKYLFELYYIISIKILTSLMSYYYKDPLGKDVAMAAYERLSKKFLIKQTGSWMKLIEAKVEDVMYPRGVHAKRLKRFKTLDATYAIADIQGKYRSIVKELTRVVYEVIELHESREMRSILSTNDEGKEELLDITHQNAIYHQAVKDVIYKEHEFVNDDYIRIMKELYKNLHDKELRITLEYMTKHYTEEKALIDKLIDHSLNANISYLYLSKLYPPYDKSIIAVIKFLRGFWINSKVKDKDNKEFKRLCKELVIKATKRKTNSIVVTIVVAIAIYIMLIANKHAKIKG